MSFLKRRTSYIILQLTSRNKVAIQDFQSVNKIQTFPVCRLNWNYFSPYSTETFLNYKLWASEYILRKLEQIICLIHLTKPHYKPAQIT